MSRQTRRDVLAALGTAAAVGLAGCSSGDGTATDAGMGGTSTDTGMGGTATGMGTGDTPTDTATATGTMETANARVAHFSPDAPNVDVYVDGQKVLSDVPFRAVSNYLQVPTGTRTVEITAAGDPDTVAFSGDLELSAADYSVAAIGELTSEDTKFRPLVLQDDNSNPGSDTARVRVVHASPDAPAVDVTVAASGNAIVDGAAFGDAAYVEVPAGDYTLQIRPDTEANDGSVVAEFDVSVSGASVYTAFAGGYLTPGDEPTDAAFDLTVVRDASY